MRSVIPLILLIASALTVPALSQTKPQTLKSIQDSDGLTPSEHRPGPHGLEGWTLNGPLPDGTEDDKYPYILVIARNGKEIRRFEGSAFVWKWMFVDDGSRVAYESGPLHFGMSCILADIATGRELGIYDCYHELPDNAPEWVRTLDALP